MAKAKGSCIVNAIEWCDLYHLVLCCGWCWYNVLQYTSTINWKSYCCDKNDISVEYIHCSTRDNHRIRRDGGGRGCGFGMEYMFMRSTNVNGVSLFNSCKSLLRFCLLYYKCMAGYNMRCFNGMLLPLPLLYHHRNSPIFFHVICT